MAGKYPFFGVVQSLTGTNITSSYTASSTVMNPPNASIIRFYGRATLAAGSTLTTVTVKLTFRYDDPQANIQLGYKDLPSYLDDVQGAAQPKGSTFEIDHVFSVTAGQSNDFTFYLPAPYGINDMITNIKASATGNAADSVTIYAVAG